MIFELRRRSPDPIYKNYVLPGNNFHPARKIYYPYPVADSSNGYSTGSIFWRCLQKHTGWAQYVLLIPVIFTVFFLLALNRTEIIMNNDGLTYKSLFSTKEVLWNNVVKTYIRYHQHGKSGSHYRVFETSEQKIKFLPAFFSRKSLRVMAEAVTA